MEHTGTDTFYNAEKKIWSGPKRKDPYAPEMTLGEVALLVLSRTPDKIMQVCDSTGEELTASKLIRDSKLVVKNLLRLGLKPGDVVGISANNTPNLAAIVLGTFLCGTPTNALFPGFDKESVQIIFKVTTPKIIFCDMESYAVTRDAVKALNLEIKIFVVNGHCDGVPNIKDFLVDDGSDLENMRLPCEQLTGDDIAAILCSSGTTGMPKGIHNSHRALINMGMYSDVRPDSALFTFSTLYWASGLWTFTASLINGVKRIITDKPFTPEYFLQIVQRQRVTHFMSGPHQMAQLLQNPPPNTKECLASIRQSNCGGSKIPQVVSEKLNAILGDEPRSGLTVGYGLSELSGMLSENDGGPGYRRQGSDGKLLPNTEVRILDNSGELLGPNVPGLLHIRTPYKWAGYYNNPEATAKGYVDDWVVTSDIGYFDDDGFLHICTRDNDVFKSSGFQIYPQQIEDVVRQLSGVLEACVFGVPDFIAGNLTACAIVRAENEAGANLTADDIVKQVEKNMSSVYHLKGGVHFLDTFPKTGSGKVQRRNVVEMLKIN